MRRPTFTWLAVGAFVGFLAVQATATVLVVRTRGLGHTEFGESTAAIVMGAIVAGAFACVGLVLAAKRSRNAIGWIFLVIAITFAAGLDGAPANVFGRYALYSMAHGDAWPGTALAASLAQMAWVSMLVCAGLLLLLFPYGCLPSRGWRWLVVLLGVAATVAWIGGTTAPGRIPDPFGRYENPLGVAGMRSVDPALRAAAFLMLVSTGAAVGSLIQRLRRAEGIERQQYSLFTAAAAAFLIGVVATQVADATIGGGVATVVGLIPPVAATILPVATAIAILRYRLYEIDRIVSRTLVYAVLTLVLGLAYAGLVLTSEAFFSSFAGGSNLAIAASTLVVAALFLPARSRLQSFVDRRFYRRRYDAQRTLEGFGARLREQVDLATLERDLQAVVIETMQPERVSVWLRRKGLQ